MDPSFTPILFIVGSIIGLFLFLYILPINLWFTAQLSGVRISLLNLVLMRLRKVSPSLVTNIFQSVTAGCYFHIRD